MGTWDSMHLRVGGQGERVGLDDWAKLGWTGLGWAGLGWAGLGWAGRTGRHLTRHRILLRQNVQHNLPGRLDALRRAVDGHAALARPLGHLGAVGHGDLRAAQRHDVAQLGPARAEDAAHVRVVHINLDGRAGRRLAERLAAASTTTMPAACPPTTAAAAAAGSCLASAFLAAAAAATTTRVLASGGPPAFPTKQDGLPHPW